MYQETSYGTVKEVAKRLGVSSTTVSRAKNGKGRISAETKSKVKECCREVELDRKGRTFNICVVFEENYNLPEFMYFQRIIRGIQETVGAEKYDLICVPCTSDDMSNLERIVFHKKVDGVILLEAYDNRAVQDYLIENKVPYVLLEKSDEHEQAVGMPYQMAAKELVYLLQMTEGNRIAFISGDAGFQRNRDLLKGYRDAFRKAKVAVESRYIYADLKTELQMEKALSKVMKEQIKTIVCADDYICKYVLHYLENKGLSVPRDIKVASLCESNLLDHNTPSVTSILYDAHELGKMGAKLFLAMIKGEPKPRLKKIPFTIELRDSTNWEEGYE